MCTFLSGRYQWAVVKAKGGHKYGVSLHRFPGNTSVASKWVAHLKPIPGVEVSGEVNQPFSQVYWKSVCLLAVQCPG